MKTSEILNKAADEIEERGWMRGGEGWYETGPLCLEGGIMAAMGVRYTQVLSTIETERDFRTCPAYMAVFNYLDMNQHEYHTKLYHFNDSPNRTKSEVVEVLRAAALIESAREDASVDAPKVLVNA